MCSYIVNSCENKNKCKFLYKHKLFDFEKGFSSQDRKVGFIGLRRTKVTVSIIIEESIIQYSLNWSFEFRLANSQMVYVCVTQNIYLYKHNLTIIALTMSLLLFFRARTAFARDTLACDITSSMSFTSTPVSSTYSEEHSSNTERGLMRFDWFQFVLESGIYDENSMYHQELTRYEEIGRASCRERV